MKRPRVKRRPHKQITLPAFSMGKSLVDISNRDSLEDAMRPESVARHRQWQKKLDKNDFFDDVFSKEK